MNKSELIEAVATKSELTKANVEKALNAYFETVTETLKSGESITVVGFGSFEVADRAARIGRNPKTGAEIKIAATKTPKFKAGKSLKDAVASKSKANPTKKK